MKALSYSSRHLDNTLFRNQHICLLSTVESDRHFQFAFVIVTDAINCRMITHHQLPLFTSLGGHCHSLGFISNSNRLSPQLCSQPLQRISLSCREQLCGRVNDHNLLMSASHFVGAAYRPFACNSSVAICNF